MLGAIEASLAGGRVQRDYAHALLECLDARPDFFDHAGQLVPKQCRRYDHLGVIASLVDLEIGATSESDLDLDQDFAFAHARDRHLLDLHVLFAVEDGGCHFPGQNLFTLFPS